jgi:hypothetical protein
MKSITYILMIISTFLLAWLLPWANRLTHTDKENYPFPYYSCVTHSFCYTQSDEKKLMRMDARDNQYTEAEYDSILPFFYFRQLLKDGRLPDSINGVKMTPKLINTTNFFYRYKPKDKNTPAIQLFPLFESMSKKVDLEMPGDVFRFSDNITFIDPETNTIKTEKSNPFMETFHKKGFVSPARLVAGTPTTRKNYDEGYFIVDNHHQVFHLKMVNGKPFVKNTGIDTAIQTRFIATTEYPSKKSYGFLFDKNNQLYAISTEKYQLVKIPVPPFSPDHDDLLIMGNMFHWNVRVTSGKRLTAYAIDAKTFGITDSISFAAKAPAKTFIGTWILPFSLSFTSYDDEYVKPRFEFYGLRFLWTGIILAILFLAINRKKGKTTGWVPVYLWIILTGVFGFISALIVNPLKLKS